MSREAFSQDPQDARDSSTRPSGRHDGSQLSDARGNGNTQLDVPSGSAGAAIPEEPRTHEDRTEIPRAYEVRDRAYLLCDSEMHSLKEIGKFRVIPVADLAKHAYDRDERRMEKDLRGLVRQGLLTDRTLEISQKKTLRVVTLTKAGHRQLRKSNQLPDDQPIYHGLVKPRELKHDADLYRLYQKEAARIARAGGRPVRILLDFELKRNLNRDLALLGPEKDNPERKRQVAEKNGLQLVNGKIPLPDLRVEYETPEGERRHVDLEIATRDYRPKAMAEKAKAGFSFYSRPEDASRLRRVLDERELTAGILSL